MSYKGQSTTLSNKMLMIKNCYKLFPLYFTTNQNNNVYWMKAKYDVDVYLRKAFLWIKYSLHGMWELLLGGWHYLRNSWSLSLLFLHLPVLISSCMYNIDIQLPLFQTKYHQPSTFGVRRRLRNFWNKQNSSTLIEKWTKCTN